MAAAEVKEFHEVFGVPKLNPHDHDDMAFRLDLIFEEVQEVFDAAGWTLSNEDGQVELYQVGEVNKADLLKELADLVYVVYGMAETFGWNLDEAVARVHASNLSKLGPDGHPIRRPDGKVLKGPNYEPPFLGDLV